MAVCHWERLVQGHEQSSNVSADDTWGSSGYVSEDQERQLQDNAATYSKDSERQRRFPYSLREWTCRQNSIEHSQRPPVRADAGDGASKGKGSDHFGDAKKDENTASSDDKHLITDGNKAKENDDEANEDKKEEHESSDKGDSGDKLADSKIMARLARAPRRVKDPTFPEKYVLHDGYKWITDYIFKGGSQKPVIILVDPYEHKKGDPLINDKPTFEISKPEKKPDDKPKTPDKSKVPDKITVPDIPDVPEPNPAVVTTDEPKEPKGENVDETLTTGVKGQDVTKTKQNNPVKPMAQDIKQPKQPVVQKVSLNSPKATLPQTGERSSILLSVLGRLVALTGLLYLDKDRKNKKA